MISNDEIKNLVSGKVRKIELACDKRVKEIKPFVFSLASNFLKEQVQHVTDMLT